MKKRILSMLLAVITVVVMIPAALVTAIAEATTPTPGYADGYDIFVSDIEPTLDGKMDDMYKQSELITGESENANFTAYALVTTTGFYVFGNVIDGSMDVDKELNKKKDGGFPDYVDARDGDKFTVFLQIANMSGNKTQWAWGYFDTDYAWDAVASNGNFNHANRKVTKQSQITTDGYTIELFLPWDNCAKEITEPISLDTVKVYLGIQVNNWYYANSKGDSTYGTVYDNPECGGYWHANPSEYDKNYHCSSGSEPSHKMLYTNFKTAPYHDGYGVYVSSTEPTVDGVMDEVYKKSEKIDSTYINKGDVSFKAYALVTAKGFYLFADVEDTTKEEFTAPANGDKLQLYIQLANTNASGVVEWAYNYFEMDYGHTTTTACIGSNTVKRTVKGSHDGTTGYTLEFCMEWENCSSVFSGDKISPETLDVYFGVQVNHSPQDNNSTNNDGIAYDNFKTIDYWHYSTNYNGAYKDNGYEGDRATGTEPKYKMIPANFIWEGTTGYHDGYDTIVAAPEQITLDGDLDSVYLNSEKIVPNYYHQGLMDADFYAYTAVTEEGLYVWANIEDSTVNANKELSYADAHLGDKFQVCLEVSNGTTTKWGYFDFDYSSQPIYYGKNGDFKEGGSLSPELKTKIVDGGWVAECFIPWKETGITAESRVSLNDVSAYIGFQFNNFGESYSLKHGQSFDNPETINYYDKGSSAGVSIDHFIPLNFLYGGNQPLDNKGVNIPAFSVYSHSETITVDGLRDQVYLNSQKISEQKVTGSGTGFDAYISVTKDGLYLYADIEDTTLGDGNDCIKIYLTDTVNADKNVVNCVELAYDGTATGEVSVINVTETNVTSAVKAVRNAFGVAYGWTAELFIPWSAPTNLNDDYTKDTGTAAPSDPNEEDTVPRAPYACSVGISVQNGTNYSYSNPNRTDWDKSADYDYDSKESASSQSYYVPLSYTTYTPEVHNLFVTDKDIVLDGTLDEIYKQSTMLTDRYHNPQAGSTRNVDFTAYYVATLEGLYMWVYTDDKTMNNIHDTDANSGDMIQLYIDWTLNYRSHEITGKTENDYRINDDYFYGGWISFDYEGNISANLEAAYLVPETKMVRVKHDTQGWNPNNYETPEEAAKHQYCGYTIEAFVPWTDEIKDQLGVHANDIHMSIGLQVSDDENYDYNKSVIWNGKYVVVNEYDEENEKYVDVSYLANENKEYVDESGNVVTEDKRVRYNEGRHRYGYDYRSTIAYDTNKGGSYYGRYEYLPDINFIYDDALAEYSRFIADTVDSVTVDGENTNHEYDYASVINVNIGGNGIADDGDIIRVVATNEAVYILMELIDNTPSKIIGVGEDGKNIYDKQGKWVDYIDLAVNFGGRYTMMYTFERSDAGNEYYYLPDPTLCTARWHDYLDEMTFAEGDIACTDSGTKWTYEIRIPFTAEDKAKIADGIFYIGIGAQFLDSYDTDGDYTDGERNYKYNVKNSGIYLGDYVVRAYENYKTLNTAYYPSEVLKYNYLMIKNNDSKITGANVSLGENINVKYYAYIDDPASYDENVYMKFTMNNKETWVKGIPYEPDGDVKTYGNYLFVFEGVAPQCIIDNIEAELYIARIKDTSYKAEKLEYSIYENVNNIKTEYDEYDDLIDALLHYGAAAQKYMNYKTGKLANAYIDPPTYADSIENNDKYIGPVNASIGAKFSALGVYHSNENKIYAKVTITDPNVDVSALKVTINNDEAELEVYDEANNIYIVYTDGIKVTEFDDKVFTFVLSNETNTQTLTYSINAYAKAKWSATGTVGGLARALYAYGEAAKNLNA